MAIVKFQDLMADAEQGGYAVGYFESWNLESLLAVADAAQASHSPVILGFSGRYLPDLARRIVSDPLAPYARMAEAVARGLSVPACLLFNESPSLDWVQTAIREGFGLVMYTDEHLAPEELELRVARLVQKAHAVGVAVEGEMDALPGLGGELNAMPQHLHLSEPARSRAFIERTGVDALAVNVGQVHMHARCQVRLNLPHLAKLRAEIPVPLALHGASSLAPADIAEAVRLGIRKINVGSVLKKAFFEAMRDACSRVDGHYNPYEVAGSGYDQDVMVAGRLAMRRVTENLMQTFGSAGKA
jgi:fructose/tagatose bisphosphate aldolase